MYDGQRIRKLREEHNLTQEELAEFIGISLSQVRRHEASTVPSGYDTLKYAEYFRVSADYILGLSDIRNPTVDESNLTDRERNIISSLRQGDIKHAIMSIIDELP